MSELVLSELIKKRGTCKGRLTNFEKYLASFNNILVCTEVQAIEIKVRLEKIQDNFSEFDTLQSNIDLLTEDEDDQLVQLNQRSDFETQHYRCIARAQEILKVYHRAKPKHNDGSESDSDDDTVKPNDKYFNGIKLPTITIPKFSGDYTNWLEFRDTYVSLIHNNSAVSSIQKFHYLKSSLEGSAAEIVQAIKFSASNYSIAWSSLCERFDNARLLVHNHVRALFTEEQIKKESADALRKLSDAYCKNLRALEIMGEPVKSWDTLLIYIMTSKLDARSLREWEEHKSQFKSISLEILKRFIRNRADLLETIELNTTKDNNVQRAQPNKPNKNIKGLAATTQSVQTKNFRCPACNEEHFLYKCESFLQMTVDDRQQLVKAKKLCLNCFRPNHNYRACRLAPCKMCRRKHNSLLHKDSEQETVKQQSETTTVLSASNHCGQVLLATAIVNMRDANDKIHQVKAVLDSGSQASFMTEALMVKLGLKSETSNLVVSGINNAVSAISKKCDATIQSTNNSFQAKVTFLVLPQITSSSNQVVDINTIKIPRNITLADPEFYRPSSLDLLLGADIFWDLIGANQVRLGKCSPVLQETKLGYIVSGPTGKHNTNISCNYSQFEAIQDQLAKFWLIEDIPHNTSTLSEEERSAEEHFFKNFTRESDGRFAVGIPLKMSTDNLGDSFKRAQHCFFSLERRLQKQSVLRTMYVDFMAEYIKLGHMTKSTNNVEMPPIKSYFLPHHGVLREQSTTTKLRAVFNASAKTTSGLSLNDIQMVGPTIQSDLLSLLLRFRQHRFVLAGDIEKMYRQVLIHENQRHLQQIIWRDDPSKPLDTFTLNTVTYGTASAPFLAVRCLKQLADECGDEEVGKIIRDDFYVDDLLTGHATAEGLLQIRTLVSQVLASGCFNLRKFRSNLPAASDDYDQSDHSAASAVLRHESEQSKTLGLKWLPGRDELKFAANPETEKRVTKRSILSAIAQVFDPLGLLSCIIITGKIILQKLWLHKLQWDDQVPRDVATAWSKFVEDLNHISEVRITRHVLCLDPIEIHLHVFCDASKDAYGACVYVRSESANGDVQVHLLCSKSRVAPLKACTIPRLELCGAATGTKLLQKVLTTTRLEIKRCVLWTDSSVVIGWLKTPPNKLKPFVKNRVANIQEETKDHEWRHVPTAQNPADSLSRGIGVAQTNKLQLWFNGPQFLNSKEESWPNRVFDQPQDELPEITSNVVTTNDGEELFPFERFSKMRKIENTMAYVLRFVNNCSKPVGGKVSGPLSHSERQNAHSMLLKISQRESFPEEYADLAIGKPLPVKNRLLSLTPFMDKQGLIRVGGRLDNGEFEYDRKHPILLLAKHPYTKLIFEFEHIRLMHAGPQLLLNSVRQEMWPLGGRNLSKQVVHKCQRCYRLNPRNVTPVMGNLPQKRIQPGYPFQTTAMDYAGPIIALNRRGRGSKTEKVYIAIFVCFTTKSIHLELVSDLSKDSFLATLKRFIARRSKPHCLYSDNGTQFVGAKNELAKFFKENSQQLADGAAAEGIEFQFIPAYTPHMAGLAEAGVKSVKGHLKRVLGNAHLVFEDLYTVLVQIEAILNSRPLTPLSCDPNDFLPLTPGHFLVGRPLTALPTPPLANENTNRLSRFERLEQMRQHFWIRWSKEYISELQIRTKWRTSKGDLKEGTLVLLKDENLPPLRWNLGRVRRVHPGADGIARVADVQTTNGIVRRAFNRICPLPE